MLHVLETVYGLTHYARFVIGCVWEGWSAPPWNKDNARQVQ